MISVTRINFSTFQTKVLSTGRIYRVTCLFSRIVESKTGLSSARIRHQFCHSLALKTFTHFKRTLTMGSSLEQYRLSLGSYTSFRVAKLCEVHEWTKICFYLVIFVTFYSLPAFLLYHVSALLAFSAAAVFNGLCLMYTKQSSFCSKCMACTGRLAVLTFLCLWFLV